MRPLLLLPAVALQLLCGAPLAADAQLGPPHVDWFARDITEPLLQDAACNMETVETANSMQLHALLQELSETAFFRLINVNMEGKCQYFGEPDKVDEDEPACESRAEPSAPPLCSLGTDDAAAESADPFGAGASSFGGGAFGGGAFGGDSMDGGMSSAYSDPVDHSITPEEDAAIAGIASTEDCSDDTLPSFWLDMCSNIPTNASDYVNLQLNAESYTGYNGSHVWDAIYKENCLARLGGHDEGMCVEERVLYRLLSGMHAATNTHIARFYHPPSKRKNRTEWQADIGYFRRQFDGHPERIKNLHFAFVVLLRAVRRASPFLAAYDFAEGEVGGKWAEVDGRSPRTGKLVARVLDSSILKSCNAVFDAFDEGVLFREQVVPEWWSLKKQFKGVFHNVSKVLDCVSCQKCRLHAKVTMLGYGCALKMLLLPHDLLPTAFSRDEIVALFNTLAKFSSAIMHVKELTEMIYQSYYAAEGAVPSSASSPASSSTPPPLPAASPSLSPPAAASTAPSAASASASASASATSASVAAAFTQNEASGLMDVALGAIAGASRAGKLSAAEEVLAVSLAVSANPQVLLLAKHFGAMSNFATHLTALLPAAAAASASAAGGALGVRAPTAAAAAASAATSAAAAAATSAAVASSSYDPAGPDAVVIGSGVAGMTSALRLLDRGARVILLEKERKVGGNSAKASSGINGCCPGHSRTERTRNDTIESFAEDTARSAKRDASEGGLIMLLAKKSAETIDWLRERTAIDLSKIAQLGGHSHARTHRPANGMIGAELTFALHRELKAYVKSGQLQIRTNCRLVGFLTEGGKSGGGSSRGGEAVAGVRYVDESPGGEGAVVELRTPQTVLATGGYANDRTNTSLLAKHRPDLLSFPTTNGEWATGDGMKLAMGELGAGSVDMDKVQVHPTGFVDPKDVGNPTKVLCGEMMRGVGGILLAPTGQRFVNELSPRDKVVDAQLGSGHKEFAIVLNEAMAAEAGKHAELYLKKGLLTKLHGADALASWLAEAAGNTSTTTSAIEAAIRAALTEYNDAAVAGADAFGKTSFRHAPYDAASTLYAGRIAPVLHYTMGGIKMDNDGRVLREDGSVIERLSAAGEVTGGVHGNNRLGGNSLLECAVFGSVVGNRLPIASLEAAQKAAAALPPAADSSNSGGALGGATEEEGAGAAPSRRQVGRSELASHASEASCWVALYGLVYDFTSFLDEHPAGAESILKLGGTDGTEMYETVHHLGMLADFEADVVGAYAKEID